VGPALGPDRQDMGLLKGRPFEFQHPYGSYMMENILFKISYLAKFHAQTAVEAAHIVSERPRYQPRSQHDKRARTARASMQCLSILSMRLKLIFKLCTWPPGTPSVPCYQLHAQHN
jgi:2-methylcitrate dehydratase PrpD